MFQVNTTFMFLGLMFAATAVFIRPLFNLNLRVYETIGLRSFSGFWRRQSGWWIPTICAAAAFGAFGFIALGLING